MVYDGPGGQFLVGYQPGGHADRLSGAFPFDPGEELNLLVPGADYGWFEREGTFVVDPLDAGIIYDLPADDAGYTYPVAMYDHDEGIAIAGGYVYRGAAIPQLQGQYVFADLVTGRMFHVPVDELVQGELAEIKELTLLDPTGNPTRLKQIIGANRADVRFGLDADGEIYLLTKTDGQIRKLFNPAGSAEPNTPGFDFVDMLTPLDDGFDADALGHTGTIFVDALAGNDTVTVGPLDDRVSAGDGNDVVNRGSGADTIDASFGNDMVNGGNGNDSIEGGPGDDLLAGNSGNDNLNGGTGNDTLIGSGGADNLYGAEGRDLISGGGAADLINGGSGNDCLKGNAAMDTIIGGGGRDYLSGGSEDDSLSGGSGQDTLYGENGKDTLAGGGGGDLLDGGEGADSLSGANAADTLFGGDGNDVLRGEGFADVLFGGQDDDTLFGGGNSDVLSGDHGADRLYGQRAADTLDGGSGDDRLNGGAGNDLLKGGDGSDTLLGSTGDDQLYGGSGADHFQFFANHGAFDRIFDFEDGSDVIEFNIATLNDFGDLTLTATFMGVDIDYGFGTIRVLGTRVADFSESDFVFL